MPSELITERRAHTLVLTICGPRSRNALSEQLCAAGIESLNVASSDDEVRCVVLQGHGADFSSGADLAQLEASMAPGSLAQAGQRLDRLHELIEAIRTFPKPVIACIEGQAAGSGLALALACDFIVAAEDAQLSMSHGPLGLSPDGGSSWQLLQLMPRHLALQMMWLPDPKLSPRQLQSFGVVNWVTDTGTALERALLTADKLAQMPANVLATVKELSYQWPGQGLREHMAREAEQFMANLKHPNAKEGVRAFLEARAPRFE